MKIKVKAAEEGEPRSLVEIAAAEQEFFDRVWYARKLELLHNIEFHNEEVPAEEIFDQLSAQMKALEERYGVEDLTPQDEFEVGMIHGKLSALRWMLGDEWDMLDT